MNELLTALFGMSTIYAMLRFATPLILASLGGLFSERSGVVNIALEGMMTAGAFFAIFGTVESGSWVVGALVGMLAGALLGLVHAIATVTFYADQIISGTAIILLAAGLVNFINLRVYGGSAVDVPSTPPRFLDNNVSIYVFIAALAVVATFWVIWRTPFGLHLRAVGEHPRAADTVGISPFRMRYIAVVTSGALAGLAGTVISFNVSSYTEGMVAGNGFIALAALIFGKWNPFGAAAACLLFGYSQALASRLGNVDVIPSFLTASELLTALPYLITLIALAGFVGKSTPPAAIGKPYVK